MPEYSLADSILTGMNAQEPWPDNVKLFQPYEVEQILLPDNASCLAVQAFLKMCNLPFEVEMRWNAEFMSPSGRVPFIKCGAFVVSELEPIVQFAANKGVSLCSRLSTEEKAEMRAYMSLITNVLVNAELYISWVDSPTFAAVTRARNSSVYPWPLGWLQTRAKRQAVVKRLKALHWHDKTLEQVIADVEQCCTTLSQRLGDKDYFFGTPTPLDALLYGHIRALLSASGPRAAAFIKPITTALLTHLITINNITRLKLTAQEEYLLRQAFHVSRRNRAPERTLSERSTRIQRSKLSVKHPSRDSLAYNRDRDILGFQPFASKQITIITTKEGKITCKFDTPNDLDAQRFILETLKVLVDQAVEKSEEKNDYDKNDFEVIVHPNQNFVDSKYEGAERSEYLDTIEENDLVESSGQEDVIQVINDEDSDGLINNKMLSEGGEIDSVSQKIEGSDFTDSSNMKKDEEFVTVTISSSGDRASFRPQLSSDTATSRSRTSGSVTTLKPSEDMSVESLLKCLRQKNAPHRVLPDVADID